MLVIWPKGPAANSPGASTSAEQWSWATGSIVWYAVFLGNWLNHKISEIGILWTICVEEQFYVLLPLFLSYAISQKHKSVTLAISVALCSLSIFVLSKNGQISPVYIKRRHILRTFAFGAAAAFIFRNKMPKVTGSVSALIIILMILVLILWNIEFWWGPFGLTVSGFLSIFCYQLVPALMACVVYLIAIKSEDRLLYFLRSSALRTFGILSYGIYLFHVVSHRLVNLETDLFGLSDRHDFITYHLLFVQYVSIAVLFAAISRGIIEGPVLSWRGRFLPSSSSAIDARWTVDLAPILIGASIFALCCALLLVLLD